MLRKLETYLENKILTLPSWLSAHLKRTADVAVELANNHEVDPIRCKLSALAHDIAKIYDNNDVQMYMKPKAFFDFTKTCKFCPFCFVFRWISD